MSLHDEAQAIVRQVHLDTEAERQARVLQEFKERARAAEEPEPPSAADVLQAEWDELDRPWREGWQVSP